MKKIRFKITTIPLAIFFLAVTAYGLLLPWMGFYWDDWPFAWITHFRGPWEFIEAFRPFRPFLGPIFTLTTGLLGVHPLGWQIFGLLLRVLTGLAVWWVSGILWPQRKREGALLSLCFVVFPGYLSQWVALTHSNQELISLLATLLSFGVMGLALSNRRRYRPLTLAALVLMFAGLFPTEYFIGLELLRPFVLWFHFETQEPSLRKRSFQVLKTWAPYLALWLANALWLYFYQSYGAYSSYGIKVFSNLQLPFIQVVTKLVEDAIQAVAMAGFAAWTEPFSLLTQPLHTLSNLLSIGLAAVVFAATLFYLGRLEFTPAESRVEKTPWPVQAMVLGVLGILLGRIPSWIAGLPLALEFSWDRFMLSMMLGGSLFLVGLVEFLLKDSARKTLVFSLFIALAASRQFTAANTFRRDWDNQRQFFWQLTWRIPALQPNSLLVTHELPLIYESDLNLTAPLNWIYAPTISSKELPYMLAYTRARLGTSLLPKLQPDLSIDYPYRTMTFHGSTSNMVVFYHPTPGCVRVLDPVFAGNDTTPGMSYLLTDAIPLSNLSLIQPETEPPTLPAFLFGNEPPHTWCYYFERAELARQAGEWSKIVELGETATQQGFSASAPVEWLPFIEAYARTGNLEQANRLTQLTHETVKELDPALCTLWERVAADPASLTPVKIQADEIKSGLQCEP